MSNIVVGVGQRDADYEVLAERRDRVRLTRVTDADRVRFTVEEVNADGTVMEPAIYAASDFFAAIDEFDRRALRLFDPPVAAAAAIMSEMVNAVGRHDIELLQELLDDDFRLVEHRSIGFPDMGRAELIAASGAVADEDHARYLTRAVHVMDETGAVVSGGFWRNHHGEWTEYFVSAAIILVEHGRVTLNELFSEDQLDAAIVRFAELTEPPDTS